MQSNIGDSVPPRWRLSADHRELLDRALRSAHATLRITPELREAVREIRLSREKMAHEQEDSLIAFKLALVDAANAAEIQPGPDRNDLFAKLITIYIDESHTGTGSPEGSREKGAQRFTSDS